MPCRAGTFAGASLGGAGLEAGLEACLEACLEAGLEARLEAGLEAGCLFRVMLPECTLLWYRSHFGSRYKQRRCASRSPLHFFRMCSNPGTSKCAVFQVQNGTLCGAVFLLLKIIFRALGLGVAPGVAPRAEARAKAESEGRERRRQRRGGPRRPGRQQRA